MARSGWAVLRDRSGAAAVEYATMVGMAAALIAALSGPLTAQMEPLLKLLSQQNAGTCIGPDGGPCEAAP